MTVALYRVVEFCSSSVPSHAIGESVSSIMNTSGESRAVISANLDLVEASSSGVSLVHGVGRLPLSKSLPGDVRVKNPGFRATAINLEFIFMQMHMRILKIKLPVHCALYYIHLSSIHTSLGENFCVSTAQSQHDQPKIVLR